MDLQPLTKVFPFLQKKILIVDDLNTSSSEGLKEMTAPLDVMISVPKGVRGNSNSRFVSVKTKENFLSRKEKSSM